MPHEQLGRTDTEPVITPEQWEAAEDMIELLGLSEAEAGTGMLVRGQTGTVRYGLARCADHMTDMTPSELRAFIDLGIDAARQASA